MTKEENKTQTAVTLSHLLRNARKAKGWTLYRLSKETGITDGHLSKIESGGGIAPRVDMLQRITQALDVRISFPLEFVME